MADNIQIGSDGKPIPHREDVIRETVSENASSMRRKIPKNSTKPPSAKSGFMRAVRDGVSNLMNAGFFAGALIAAAPDDGASTSGATITQGAETAAPETSIKPKPRTP